MNSLFYIINRHRKVLPILPINPRCLNNIIITIQELPQPLVQPGRCLFEIRGLILL